MGGLQENETDDQWDRAHCDLRQDNETGDATEIESAKDKQDQTSASQGLQAKETFDDQRDRAHSDLSQEAVMGDAPKVESVQEQHDQTSTSNAVEGGKGKVPKAGRAEDQQDVDNCDLDDFLKLLVAGGTQERHDAANADAKAGATDT